MIINFNQKTNFYLCLLISLLWGLFSVFLAIPWSNDLSKVMPRILAWIIIFGIAITGGIMNMFLVCSMILFKQNEIKIDNPTEPISILIASFNEESSIYDTIKSVIEQDYKGKITIYAIDNNSTDKTKEEIYRAITDFVGYDIRYVFEKKKGKSNALNTALKQVDTKYTITLDADTMLHSGALRLLVGRIVSSEDDVVAVAGAILVNNANDNIISKLQVWDYLLSITSVKKMQSMFNSTLVAQGAFSIYRTDKLNEINGWDDTIGEDIVLTWKLLRKGYSVLYEPTAMSYTNVPVKLKHLFRQRKRWARGLIEGLRFAMPWKFKSTYCKLMTLIDIAIIYVDFSYCFFWIPAVILAIFFKWYGIVGIMTLLVLPLTFISFFILYIKEKHHALNELGIKPSKNFFSLLFFLITYQSIMSTSALCGYIEEVFGLKKVWK